jgi:hypothetical protein
MLPASEREAIALCAVVEALMTATGAPAEVELLNAGRDAITKAVEDEFRARGLSWRDRGKEMPRFARYWRGPGHAPFDERVTETIAVRQVMAGITEASRKVLEALAEAGTHHAAAEELGCKPDTFKSRLSKARQAARAAWFDDETAPGRTWSSDRHGDTNRVRPVAYAIRARTRDRAAAARRRQASALGGSGQGTAR